MLNHPSVVWRRFKASKGGKRLLNARNGDVPAKQSKMARKVVDLEAEIEHLREQLAAAEVAGPRPVTGEAPAAPLQPTGIYIGEPEINVVWLGAGRLEWRRRGLASDGTRAGDFRRRQLLT